MAWYNNLFTTKGKSGPINFPARFQQMFLQRIGTVNSYEDDARTYIEEGYQQNPIVYSIVNMASKNAGKAYWCIKDGRTGEEISIPLLEELMKNPNPLQSWTDMVQDAITHKLLEGNSFITGEYGTGLNAEKYNALYVLPSEDIQIIGLENQRGIRGYRVDFNWAENTEIPASDVLHLRNPNPDFDEVDNWLFGQSSFRAARRSIQTYNESLETGVWFLQNKGSQKILFNKNDEVELSPEATDQLKNKLRQQTQGPKNSGNIPIIDGEFGVLDVSANAEDALVLEQRMQSAREICAVINFPGQLIGLSDATYQNAKEAKKALWENIIIPELHELKQGFNRWLAPQFGPNVMLDYKLDHIDALREDRPVQDLAGLATIDEARARVGLPPKEEGGSELYLGFVQGVKGQDNKTKPNTNDGTSTQGE